MNNCNLYKSIYVMFIDDVIYIYIHNVDILAYMAEMDMQHIHI